MSFTLPDKNRNVDVNEIIKLYNLPDDTKRIVQRTKTKISKEPGKTHTFYDRVYLRTRKNTHILRSSLFSKSIS